MKNQPIDITKLSVTELKAMAYDILVEIEKLSANNNILLTELKRRAEQNPVATDPVQDVPKEEPKK